MPPGAQPAWLGSSSAMLSVRETQQGSQAPKRSHSSEDDKAESYQAAGKSALAPTLEHGCQSNREQQDRNQAKGFKPHIPISRVRATLPPVGAREKYTSHAEM